MKKRTLVLLITSLALILIGSLIASISNNSGGDVDVSRISFETDSGELSGLLYLPDGAESEPRPTIVATHGYLNSAEMQAPQAIEMSKRGYVVLALDQYDHGHSVGTMDKSIPFFSFWPTSIYDAVNYMYEQDYVLKDEDGNGIIAVSGHSMGGFSSTHAILLDEMFYEQAGIRKIDSYLSMGSDYQWIYALGYELEDIAAAYGPRTAGKIAGTYDEFFFSPEATAQGQTVVEKNYIATEEGQAFLGHPEDPTVGEFYAVGDGQRIIYQPEETHPWNHFSMTTTDHVINFYDEAFAEYDVVETSETGQSWMYKEWFSFVALIGFFLLFVPVVQLLLKVPFLSDTVVEKPKALPLPATDSEKTSNLVMIIFGAFFPALLFTTFYSGVEVGLRLITQINYIMIATSLISLIVAYVKDKQTHMKKLSISVLIIGIIQFLMLRYRDTLIEVSEFFGAPTGNTIVYWALHVAIITALVLVISYFASQKAKGVTLDNYGLKTKVKPIFASFVVAVIAIAVGYLMLFIVDAIFKTDFRLWTLAVKTFEAHHLVALMKYAPLFFVFYFVVGLSINVNTADERFEGIKGYLVSIFMFVGGLIFYLLYQYGSLFMTGTAAFPAEALSSIVVIGLVPVLIIAAIFNRYFYRLTGNIYLGAFINALLMTLILLANTALYATL
ncbi:serine aminopeptidase S33 family [Streptohalobacillus salinus]|uniref:Serine aminopeptidase S33 family n=1 Tax=Streptohalobacillus salinus TaxID=621096 RepID=A0A2V3W5J9_9BACI|nr:alpha/beta hydrolase [Streptohalobacillus salinus]PXW88301.1 serine aminopeptidase S33 family [Streptohalobacillus salinus]